jgi:hypothetical protein
MNILQKEGFVMTNNPEIGACFAARTSAVRTHQDELLAEAEAWRQARAASRLDESKPGLRRTVGRTVGLALVRVGRSLADDPKANRTNPNRTNPA